LSGFGERPELSTAFQNTSGFQFVACDFGEVSLSVSTAGCAAFTRPKTNSSQTYSSVTYLIDLPLPSGTPQRQNFDSKTKTALIYS